MTLTPPIATPAFVPTMVAQWALLQGVTGADGRSRPGYSDAHGGLRARSRACEIYDHLTANELRPGFVFDGERIRSSTRSAVSSNPGRCGSCCRSRRSSRGRVPGSGVTINARYTARYSRATPRPKALIASSGAPEWRRKRASRGRSGHRPRRVRGGSIRCRC